MASTDPTPFDPNTELAALLAARGVQGSAAIEAVRELRVLAQSQVPAELIARAVATWPAVAGEPGLAARAESWIRGLIASIDRAAAQAVGAVQPMPQVAGVRRALDADRFRLEGGAYGVQLGIECERLPAGAGWRLVGMVAASDDVPAGIELCFVDRTGAERTATVDDLAMFECTLPEGAYACSLRAAGTGTPTVLEFSVP